MLLYTSIPHNSLTCTMWECCELYDMHFYLYVHVCHSLCCVMYDLCSKTDTLMCVCMHAHTIIHECMQTTSSKIVLCPPSLQTCTATTANSTLFSCCTHTHAAQQYTTPTFSSLVQIVGCVLYWPCPTQSSGWSYPTDVGSWCWSPSSGQAPGGDVPLWCV